jgi:hypothetical protein
VTVKVGNQLQGLYRYKRSWIPGLSPRQSFVSNPGTNIRRTSRLRSTTVLAAGIALSAISGGSLHAQALPVEQAAPAQALINTSGVVTHLNYTDSAYYTNWPSTFNALQTLGVKHIRDGYGNFPADSPLWARHQQLMNAGITTDYVVAYDTSITAQAIQQFASKVTDMEALEAPNECDVSGLCGGNGGTGIANAVSLLPTLHTAAQNLHIPLLGPSFADYTSYSVPGNIASQMDLNNVHIYFGGRNPGSSGWGDPDALGNRYGSLNFWYDMAWNDAPYITPAVTETGYMSFPTTNKPYTLPESVETAYTQRTLLLNFMHGFQETFFYELMDDPSSDAGYGLLRPDMTEKPAFIGLSNMLNLLKDTDTNFTPGKLPFQISGGDSNLNHLLFQKTDGSYWLVLWLEVPSWDPANMAPLKVTPEKISIALNSPYKTVTNYQFNSSGSYKASSLSMNRGRASLTVTDQISIIKIVSK